MKNKQSTEKSIKLLNNLLGLEEFSCHSALHDERNVVCILKELKDTNAVV